MLVARYAASTEVSVEKSKGEIERIVSRYGADQFASGWETGRAMIGFRVSERYVRFILPIPEREIFTKTETGRTRRSQHAVDQAWEQASRQAWRALALCIKAKLEAVEAEITTFDEEFMAHIVMPNGLTVGHAMVPQIAAAYETGKMPKLLPMLEPMPEK